MDVEEYLAHYGKKGMKWGVRHTPQSLSVAVEGKGTATTRRGPQGVTVVQKGRRGVVAKGGKRADAKLEAVQTSAAKQVAKKSGVHTLSNKDLQEAINRMRLEQQFKELSNPKKKKGKSFLDQQLESLGKSALDGLASGIQGK